MIDPMLSDGTGRRVCRNCGDVYQPYVGHGCLVKVREPHRPPVVVQVLAVLGALTWLVVCLIYAISRLGE